MQTVLATGRHLTELERALTEVVCRTAANSLILDGLRSKTQAGRALARAELGFFDAVAAMRSHGLCWAYIHNCKSLFIESYQEPVVEWLMLAHSIMEPASFANRVDQGEATEIRGASCAETSCVDRIAQNEATETRGASCAEKAVPRTSRVRCALVPSSSNPRTDLATPVDGEVTPCAAARLRQRKHRLTQAARLTRSTVGFPWNAASRVAAGTPGVCPRPGSREMLKCEICSGHQFTPAGDCICGAGLAESTNTNLLASFIRFVRSPNTPVYNGNDPEDQWRLNNEILCCIEELTVADGRVDGASCANRERVVVRFAGVAAISGSADVMKDLRSSLHHVSTDGDLVSAVRAHCESGAAFFRGGQAHGPLRKADAADAVAQYCMEHVDGLAREVQCWSTAAAQPERRSAVRAVMAAARSARSPFKGGDYWLKRFMEILVLGSDTTPAQDLDCVADQWPVAGGTRAALTRIFAGASTERHMRECLRVLQRALGAGTRQVPLVHVSALLCFWHRALSRRVSWPMPGRGERGRWRSGMLK